MMHYSFIIPHKNTPQLLNRCIRSIPENDDIEIIVVDDNSDWNKKPTSARKNVSIIYLDDTNSKGAGHARNVGMEVAKGKWLLFADSDDYYEDGFIDYLELYRDSDIDILYFRVNVRDESAQQDDPHNNWIDRTFDMYQRSNKTEESAHWLGLSHTCPWNKMYNHNFINSINCRFEEIAIANDAWFVNYAGIKASKIDVIDTRLYNYIMLSDGITKSRRPLSDHLDVIKSDRKRNRLKIKEGFYNLLFVPGFNKNVVIRDYGKSTYWRLVLKRMLTEPYFDFAILITFLRKINLVQNIK